MECFQMSKCRRTIWKSGNAVGTDPTLEECIMVDVRSRAAQAQSSSQCQCVAGQHDPVLMKLARSQDKIGWRLFM